MINSTRKLIFLLMSLFVIAIVVWFVANFIFDAANQHEKEQHTSVIDNALIPAGWYAHFLKNNIILTRSPQIVEAKATEIYAYGDHILISTGIFNGTFENLEEWDNTRWVFEDNALVRNWSKTEIEGLNALRIEHGAAGASGEHITYFFFSDDKFVYISLYSQDSSMYVDEFEQFVHKYVPSFKNGLNLLGIDVLEKM